MEKSIRPQAPFSNSLQKRAAFVSGFRGVLRSFIRDVNVQSATQFGHHNIIVQAQGDNIHIQVGLLQPKLKLVPVEARIRKNLRQEIDILNPAFQAIPLVGRDQDMRFLQDWLRAEAGIAVTAMVGPGGSGKTRLAFEFLQQLPQGWQGGFLTLEEANRFLGQENLSEWSWQKPTIVVVDYAALMARTLSRWFAELVDHARPDHPLRILLLERHADSKSGWYRDLTDNTWHGQAVRELFSPAEPRRIAPLDAAEKRRKVLQAGLEAAAVFAQPNKAVPPMPAPGDDVWFDQRLTANHWADPLLVLMAGVIALTDGLNSALNLTRPELAKSLAIRERDRIRKSVESPTAKDLLAHLYACVTLCGGLDRTRAADVAGLEFAALHRQYPGGAGQAVEDLARLLGAENWLAPLLPDLLGEALLPVTFDAMGADVVARLSHAAPAGVASSLVRTIQDFASAGENWPLEWLQSLVAEGESDPIILMEFEAVLPDKSLLLSESAVEVTRSLLNRLVRLPHRTSRESEYLGQLWNVLAIREGNIGKRGDALAAAAESVRIYRELVEADPEVHRPELAMSLNNLAQTQSLMGQHTEATKTIAEAVDIRRVLAKADPVAFLPFLAISLTNQASRQSEIAEHKEALTSIAEAVGHYRALADSNSEAYLPDFAASLDNLANKQRITGNLSQAMTSINEAVSIRRALAEAGFRTLISLTSACHSIIRPQFNRKWVGILRHSRP